jgi:glucose-1-phosphate thymidylyltransferase
MVGATSEKEISMKKQIRGVVLAGGTGSRLFPLTKVTNKHLLPVGNMPMIFHPIHKLVEAGITEIMIISGLEHLGDVVRLLGSGHEFNAQFTYRVQDEAGGIAQALALTEDFCKDRKCIVILGDNIFEEPLKKYVDAFQEQEQGARLLLKHVHDPERYGVPTLEGSKIVRITEKPQVPDTHYAVTGIYMYDNTVFERIKTCRPSKRGELEISDVNDHYVKSGQCSYDILDGWWTDAGTFESLSQANKLLKETKVTNINSQKI